MALISWLGTPQINRRKGLVFAAPGSTFTARAGPVGIAHSSPSQALAVTNFATAAAFWATMPTGDKDLWLPPIYPDTNAYAYFMQYNQLCLTWGCGINENPNWPYPIAGSVPFIELATDPTTQLCYIQGAYSGTTAPAHEVWLRVYWDYFYAPVDPPPQDLGSVYFGSFGPLPSNDTFAFECTELVKSFIARVPSAPGYPVPPGTYTGVTSLLSYYITNPGGQPYGCPDYDPLQPPFSDDEPWSVYPITGERLNRIRTALSAQMRKTPNR
jgi:hypothetical protein